MRVAGSEPRLASGRAMVAAVGGVALAARLALLGITSGYRPIHDDASYMRTALTLWHFGRYPAHRFAHIGWQASAYRPPGWPYTLWLAWHVTGPSVLAGRMVLVALGCATCVLGALIARSLWGDRAGLAAGLLLALDPLLLAGNASLESEVLFTTLLLGAVATALAARRRPTAGRLLATGLLAGGVALTRTNGLVVVPVLAVLAVPWPWNRRSWLAAAATGLTAIAVIAPWTVRNAIDLHRFVPVSTETGNTLAGTYNSYSLHDGGRWVDPQHLASFRPLFHRLRGGPALDSALLHAAARWAEHHPLYPLDVLGANTGRLLGLAGPGWAALSLRTMSLGGDAGLLVWLGTLLVSALGLAGLVLTRRDGVPAALLVLLVALLVPTALANGEMRLGIPLQALLAVFAGAAVVRVRRPRPQALISEASSPKTST